MNIKHPSINLTAPVEYWRALSAVSSAYRVTGREGDYALYVDLREGAKADALLLRGVGHTQANDERAIVWALDEIARQQEQTRYIEVRLIEARSVSELAKAISSQDEQSFLESILPKLTERTRFAVRQQLKQ